MDAEVDAREGDEETRERERGGEGRIDSREGQGPGRGGRRVPRGEGARGGRLYERRHLRVVYKGSGAVEEVLGTLGERPGKGHRGPGNKKVRGSQAGEQERPRRERPPQEAGGPN